LRYCLYGLLLFAKFDSFVICILCMLHAVQACQSLTAPATTVRLRSAIGTLDLAAVLEAAMMKDRQSAPVVALDGAMSDDSCESSDSIIDSWELV
jgi:hypothetical protein